MSGSGKPQSTSDSLVTPFTALFHLPDDEAYPVAVLAAFTQYHRVSDIVIELRSHDLYGSLF